ncbi:GPI mannosyltransferase 2 [Varanus komodoensis]|nr:GPI mannosyltransferase 2 [Varanus komodoensis]
MIPSLFGRRKGGCLEFRNHCKEFHIQKATTNHVMASQVWLPQKNGRDPRCQKVIWFAVCCRVISLLLQASVYTEALFNLLIPDHAADAFSPPRLSKPGSCDRLVEWLLGGLSRWDAEHFLFIAEHGYVYEHNCAFFPLFPLSLRVAAETALWPLQGVLCLRSRLLLSAALLNGLFSVLASSILYELSCAVLQCRRRALLAAILFCLTPANVFMAAAYSESMFAFLVFAAMWQLEKQRHWASMLLFSLASAVRSNGLINAGFLLYFQTKHVAFKLQKSAESRIKLYRLAQFLNWAASLVVTTAFVFLPFALFQFYAYLKFCKPSVSLDRTVPKQLLQLAVDKGYRVAASNDGKAPWCSWDLPVLYTYIQDVYWNVGFLRYFEPKQLPNFLLAAPTILLGSWAAWWYIAANPWHCLTLGLVGRKTGGMQKDSGKPAAGFSSPGVFVYMVHSTALLVFGTFCMHVQVITRFLGSSSPVLYWFSAHLLYDNEMLLQTESPSSQHEVLPCEKHSLRSSPNWSRMENPVLALLSNWRQSATLTKGILGYALSYWLLGLVLHCNFFPWT